MQRQTYFLSLFLGVLAAVVAGPTARAQSPSDLELNLTGGWAGVTAYSPERWGLVRTTVSNHDDMARTPLVAHAVGERRSIQFGHRLWLPANSRRTQLTPVMPLDPPATERSFELWTWLIDDSGEHERAAPPAEGVLIAASGPFQLGVMANRDDAATTDAAIALRRAAGHGRGAHYLSDEAAPVVPAAWDVLDALVLARTPDLSSAQLDAMRRWVFSGGRLWVMLDQVDPAFVERLLGDAWSVGVVDRVWLDTLSIADRESGESHVIDPEAGTQMLRVHAPRMRVTHEAAGYPVAAWQQVGRGRVMITTAHPGALLEPGEDEDGDEIMVAAAPLQSLAWYFDAEDRESREENELVHEALAGQARAQIGYTILSRTPVLLTLAAFALALFVAGLVFLRRGRLEWVGATGVVLAVTTAAVLVGMGKARQSDFEMTLAAADLIEPVEDQPHAVARGTFQVFRPDHASGEVTFAGPAAAIAFPHDAGEANERIRMVWHGLDRWTLPDLKLSAGAARRFTHDRVAVLDQPLGITTRLTAEGLAGQVRGDAELALDDALIAMPNGRLATAVDAEGNFAASLDDQLGDDQYVHAVGTLSQTQMSRQRTYRRLLGSGEYPAEPVLLAWTQAQEPEVEMSAKATRRGQWLLALPLNLEPPAAGERVTVPAPLMTMQPYRDAPGGSGLTVYDEPKREWNRPIRQPGMLFMRYQPPRGLRAIEVDAAVLKLDLNAPGWGYEVLRIHDGETEVVAQGRNPDGPTTVELDDTSAPALTAEGAIIGLRLRPLPGEDAAGGWSLEHMELSLRGVAR